MTSITVVVVGSDKCDPCNELKEKLDAISKISDVDFTYVNLTSKNPLEGLGAEDKEVALELLKKYPEAIPSMSIKSECACLIDSGYVGLNDLCEKISSVKCKEEQEDELPEM